MSYDSCMGFYLECGPLRVCNLMSVFGMLYITKILDVDTSVTVLICFEIYSAPVLLISILHRII